jgi:hypothetical protein
MARIRSQPSATLDSTKHELVDALVKAIKDEEPDDGLVIFEVLSGSSSYFEVIVVWDRWADLPADERNKIVMEAYQQASAEDSSALPADQISTILPVTVSQAIEMGVLPYSVQNNVLQGDVRYEKIRELLKREGAIEAEEVTELRLPTLHMARAARDRLQAATQNMQPAVHWQISQQMGRIVDY